MKSKADCFLLIWGSVSNQPPAPSHSSSLRLTLTCALRTFPCALHTFQSQSRLIASPSEAVSALVKGSMFPAPQPHLGPLHPPHMLVLQLPGGSVCHYTTSTVCVSVPYVLCLLWNQDLLRARLPTAFPSPKTAWQTQKLGMGMEGWVARRCG